MLKCLKWSNGKFFNSNLTVHPCPALFPLLMCSSLLLSRRAKPPPTKPPPAPHCLASPCSTPGPSWRAPPATRMPRLSHRPSRVGQDRAWCRMLSAHAHHKQPPASPLARPPAAAPRPPDEPLPHARTCTSPLLVPAPLHLPFGSQAVCRAAHLVPATTPGEQAPVEAVLAWMMEAAPPLLPMAARRGLGRRTLCAHLLGLGRCRAEGSGFGSVLEVALRACTWVPAGISIASPLPSALWPTLPAPLAPPCSSPQADPGRQDLRQDLRRVPASAGWRQAGREVPRRMRSVGIFVTGRVAWGKCRNIVHPAGCQVSRVSGQPCLHKHA